MSRILANKLTIDSSRSSQEGTFIVFSLFSLAEDRSEFNKRLATAR